ncbi:uncharacterized protein LOC133746566 isoform X1 [Rosa rugosa]|uniref:uncharacterized protein LOC133722433 isoform X1 n=1 Tax=Rosa rugosa TaxID=74645 RepID=UPI002B414A68|nr:uncharacterized protein LOC133722433 isoform X1 [Rosa rugosa]XP_062030719.1 uncharacterized protein LOC133746566 isoform X1 [Rosa rugosa]
MFLFIGFHYFIHYIGRGSSHSQILPPGIEKCYCSIAVNRGLSSGGPSLEHVEEDKQLMNGEVQYIREEGCYWSFLWLREAQGEMISGSSSGSINSSAKKEDVDIDCLDYEVLWEDMILGERIGQGSCGTVYHGLWDGSVQSLLVLMAVQAARSHHFQQVF